MKLSSEAQAYLKIIGQTCDRSVQLTKGFTRQAKELVSAALAIYIPISSGGSHIALTTSGITEYERLLECKQ